MIKAYATILLIILSKTNIIAQIVIRGQIKNQQDIPLELVQIELQNQNSTIIRSELTNNDGRFIIKIEKGNYLLLVKKLGDIYYTKNLIVTKNIDLETIKINEYQELHLKEVVISKKKKIIERKIDRFIFNVENSISAIGGDALDALRITPGIRVQNDDITLIGKNGMSIMIDNKVIQLSGNSLINYLRNIKTINIKSIEVITSPPAKYNAEGNSGIINIKLKTPKKDSWGGDFISSYTRAKFDLGSIGANLNFQKNKISFNSTINYNNGSTAPYLENYVYYPTVTWYETNKKRTFQNDLNNQLNFDYQVSPKTNIGIQYTRSQSKPLDKGFSNSKITNNISNQIDSLIVSPYYINTKNTSNSLNFYGIKKLDSIGKQISFDADYFEYKTNLDNNFSSVYYYGNGSEIPNRRLNANNVSYQKIRIYSSKIDMELPLQWAKISIGTKISFIKNDNQVAFYNTDESSPTLDLEKSNLFNYSENTQALYFSGSKNIAKRWELQLGLRVENTQAKGISKTIDQTNTNNYIRLFPTIYLTYNSNENNTFSLNYNRRIDRPSYADLNPFRLYSTAFNYMEGNPFLIPYFTNNIEISHNYRGLYSSISYKHLTNGIDYITVVSPATGIQIAKPSNFYTQKSIVLGEYYTFSKWNGYENNLGLNVLYAITSPKGITTVPEIDSWNTTFSSYNSFTLNKKKNLNASLDFVYSSPSVLGSYKLNSYYFFDAGIRMSFLEKKIKMAISIVDIFKTNKLRYAQKVNNIQIKALDYSNPQNIRFSLSYNFGKSLKKEERNTSNEDEKTRVNKN